MANHHHTLRTLSLVRFQRAGPITEMSVSSERISQWKTLNIGLTQVGWIATVALMTKTQIGLGVLSIPKTFDALGLIPGVICLITVAIITTWSDYMIGVFKRRHPEVYSIDDAGKLMFGRPGREFLAAVFVLCEQQVSNCRTSQSSAPADTLQIGFSSLVLQC